MDRLEMLQSLDGNGRCRWPILERGSRASGLAVPSLGLATDQQFSEALECAKNGTESLRLPEADGARHRLLQELLEVMAADGELAPLEKKLYAVAAAAMGLSAEDLDRKNRRVDVRERRDLWWVFSPTCFRRLEPQWLDLDGAVACPPRFGLFWRDSRRRTDLLPWADLSGWSQGFVDPSGPERLRGRAPRSRRPASRHPRGSRPIADRSNETLVTKDPTCRLRAVPQADDRSP